MPKVKCSTDGKAVMRTQAGWPENTLITLAPPAQDFEGKIRHVSSFSVPPGELLVVVKDPVNVLIKTARPSWTPRSPKEPLSQSTLKVKLQEGAPENTGTE